MTPVHERFLSHVKIEGECWIWQAATNNGHGIFNVAGRSKLARRVSWEMFGRELKAGIRLTTTCGSQLCVNPKHIIETTYKEMGEKMSQLPLKTHCKRGHAFEKHGVVWKTKTGSKRQC